VALGAEWALTNNWTPSLMELKFWSEREDIKINQKNKQLQSCSATEKDKSEKVGRKGPCNCNRVVRDSLSRKVMFE
jgi:hypothetical protein